MAQTGPASPSKSKVRLKGLFENGVWKCNCSPRSPATHFQVKKDGKNHGRWFYTCQESPPYRCDFFLWDDEAKSRERAAVLANSKTEPHNQALEQQRRLESNANSDLAFPGVFEDQASADSMSRATAPHGDPNPPMTPRKSSRTSQLTSPGKRDRSMYDKDSDGLSYMGHDGRVHQFGRGVSPSPTSRRPLPQNITQPAAARESASDTDKHKDRESYADQTLPFETPTNQTRSYDALATPFKTPTNGATAALGGLQLNGAAASASSIRSFSFSGKNASSANLTTEMFKIFETYKIELSIDVQQDLQSLCERHMGNARGVEKGRASLREVVKKRDDVIKGKDDDIARLKEQITSLESHLETMKRARRAQDQHTGQAPRSFTNSTNLHERESREGAPNNDYDSSDDSSDGIP